MLEFTLIIQDRNGKKLVERAIGALPVVDMLVEMMATDAMLRSGEVVAPPVSEEHVRGKNRCGSCNGTGHNAKTCPEKKGGKLKKDNARTGMRFAHKPCCGSNGPRHKKDCVNAGSTKVADFSVSNDSGPMTSAQFAEVKRRFHSNRESEETIAEEMKREVWDVNVAIGAPHYMGYVRDRKNAKK